MNHESTDNRSNKERCYFSQWILYVVKLLYPEKELHNFQKVLNLVVLVIMVCTQSVSVNVPSTAIYSTFTNAFEDNVIPTDYRPYL